MELKRIWRSQLYITLSAAAVAELVNASLIWRRSAVLGGVLLAAGLVAVAVSLALAARGLRCPACGRGMAWAVCSPDTDPRAERIACPRCGAESELI